MNNDKVKILKKKLNNSINIDLKKSIKEKIKILKDDKTITK